MRSLGHIIRDNANIDTVLARHGLTQAFPGVGSPAFKAQQAAKAAEEVRYTGHDPVHVGLQSHSIGGSYPWTVQGRGEGHQAAHLTNGTESPVYARCVHAQKALDVFKAEGRWISQEEAETLTGVTGAYQRQFDA